MLSFFAVLGLTSATLSQVIFVSGFGSSCNQPLFAKRPSKIVGSGRKTSSKEPVLAGSADVPSAFLCDSELAQSDFSETVFAVSAVFGTKPSCRHLRHHDSKSLATFASLTTKGCVGN